MIDVITKIVSPLSKVKNSLNSVSNDLANISEDAKMAGGDIARVICANISRTIENINAIVGGNDQASINNLIQYMRNIPLDQIFPRELQDEISSNNFTSATEQAKQNAQSTAAAGPIDMNPDMSQGAQSAAAARSEPVNESRKRGGILDQYFRMNETTSSQDPGVDSRLLDFSKIRESSALIDDIDLDLQEESQFSRPSIIIPNFQESMINSNVSNEDIQKMEESVKESNCTINDWRSIIDNGNMIFDDDGFGDL